eukprot:scaffold908_cov333-Prasinococcus_capsulatus_cf.AAC.6
MSRSPHFGCHRATTARPVARRGSRCRSPRLPWTAALGKAPTHGITLYAAKMSQDAHTSGESTRRAGGEGAAVQGVAYGDLARTHESAHVPLV